MVKKTKSAAAVKVTGNGNGARSANRPRVISVNATDAEKVTLEAAAAAEHRSLSNYLLTAGLEKATRNTRALQDAS